MKFLVFRRISLYALSLGIAACGAGDGSAPSAPTSPKAAGPAVGAPASSAEILMPVTNQGAQPAGFRAVFHVEPKPGTDGMIRGESPLTVEFDECGSRTDPDKTLTYLYDWNFDGVADAVGTGDSCRREHKYNVRRVAGVKGNVLFNTNVCVVSGNPRVHGPDTYFSCREFTVALPVPSSPSSPPLPLCSQLATQLCLDRGWFVVGQAQGGNIVCTIDGRSTGFNCDTCATYNIYAWEDGSNERHCPGVYSTVAGGIYSAHTPCACGDNLDLCTTWNTACLPD